MCLERLRDALRRGGLAAFVVDVERHLAEAEAVLGELLRYVQESRAELHRALPPAPEPPISE